MTALLRADLTLGGPRTRNRLLTGLALGGSVLIALVYAVTGERLGPLALPAVALGVVLLALASASPPLGVAGAFALTALTPGLVGPRAWIPGAIWVVVLFTLVVLRLPGGAPRTGTHTLPPLSAPVLVYAGAALIAIALSPDLDVGIPLLRSALTGILLFFVAGSVLRTTPDVHMAIRGTSTAALLVGGFACLQKVLGASTGVGFITSTGALVDRVTAGFEQPNLLGGFLVVLVPLAIAGAVTDRRYRLLHAAAALLAIGGVYASFSRGALLALAVVPFLLVRGRWLVLLVPAALVIAAVAVPSLLAERFAVGGGEGAEIAGRRDMWDTAGAIWLDRPLLGTGLGGFPGAYATARVVGKQFLPDTSFEPPPHAHNLGFQVLAEQGLLGFTALGAVLGRAMWDALTVRRSHRRVEALLASGLLASLAAMLVHNLFDVTLVENAGIELWGIVGILSALVALDREGEVVADVP